MLFLIIIFYQYESFYLWTIRFSVSYLTFPISPTWEPFHNTTAFLSGSLNRPFVAQIGGSSEEFSLKFSMIKTNSTLHEMLFLEPGKRNWLPAQQRTVKLLHKLEVAQLNETWYTQPCIPGLDVVAANIRVHLQKSFSLRIRWTNSYENRNLGVAHAFQLDLLKTIFCLIIKITK